MNNTMVCPARMGDNSCVSPHTPNVSCDKGNDVCVVGQLERMIKQMDLKDEKVQELLHYVCNLKK